MEAKNLTDAEYEQMTLEYWRRRRPNADSIGISVRETGKVVEFVRIAADGTATTLPASALPVPPA